MGLRIGMAVLLMLAGACSRQDITPFSALDRDHNGRISRQEAARDADLARIFDRLDTNKDGELSPLEYLRVAEAP